MSVPSSPIRVVITGGSTAIWASHALQRHLRRQVRTGAVRDGHLPDGHPRIPQLDGRGCGRCDRSGELPRRSRLCIVHGT
jgi:hypothetical protein